MTNSTKSVIEFINVYKHFGKRLVINNLSFEVYENDIFGFLGPNGAGKSTTLYMLVRLVYPSSGTIKILGKEHREVTKYLKEIGAFIEEPAFYDNFSARQNLSLLARLSNVKDKKSIAEILNYVGLLDRANDRVGTYSHGMKQRLAIAQALLTKPKVVVLDEPTNGLDPDGTREVWELIKFLSKNNKMTFLISSHLLYEIEEVCNRVAVLNEGVLVACDYLENLLKFSECILEINYPEPEKIKLFISDKNLGETISINKNSIKIKTNSIVPEELNKLFCDSGIYVSSIYKVKRTLKELFLELTKKKLSTQ